MSEYREKVEALLNEFKEQGLKSIDVDGYVDVDAAAEASENAEAYYAEFCRLLEGIKNGDGSKLVFKDSRKKELNIDEHAPKVAKHMHAIVNKRK